METSLRKRMPASALFDPKIVVPAIGSAFVKLDPRTLMKNPVMFVLEIVAALTTVILVRDLIPAADTSASSSRSSCGCGSPSCSPTSPKPSPRGAARRRPTGCGAAHRDPGQADDRRRQQNYRCVPAPTSRSATSSSSKPATSFPPTAR